MKKHLYFFCFLLISIVFASAQQNNATNINCRYFKMFLPNTWQETNSHIILDQIITEMGLNQSQSDSIFKCYVDTQNYYNVLIMGERFFSKKTLGDVSIEQLIGRSGEKKEYNGLEFLITTDTDPSHASLTYIGANTIYEDATYYFLFVLDNENLDISDRVLSSISFIDLKTEESEKKAGFFIGIWHGIRTPFVFVINIFRTNKIVIFSESGTAGYTIGYILGIIFILSGIFGGSRRRNY